MKTYALKNHATTQRSFYLSPSEDPKVTEKGFHLLIGFEIENEEFLRNIGWVIESIRSCLYKEMGLYHPMAELVQSLTLELKPEEKKKVRQFVLNADRMGDILKKFRNEDEKETE